MDRYIAPDGTPDSAGTREAPWPLAEVWDDRLRKYAQPGDTVYLVPGTYRWPVRTYGKGYRLTCTGDPESPITFRSIDNRARTTIDGGLWSLNASGTLIPKHIRIVGLEFLASENLTESRITTATGSDSYRSFDRPTGGLDLQDGHDVKIINCHVHHCSGGISFWSRVSGESELYGNTIYDNGWKAADRKHGHGLYSQNNGPFYKHVLRNVFTTSWGFSAQLYGSSAAYLHNYEFSENVSYESGAIYIQPVNRGRDNRINGNLHYGGSYKSMIAIQNMENLTSRDNCGWGGYAASNLTGTNDVRNNLNWAVGWAKPRLDGVDIPIPESKAWCWQNKYDPDRATFVVHNYQNATSIDVSLAGWAEAGDKLQLYDPIDFFGAAVHSFDLAGPTVTIPLASQHACYVGLLTRDPCATVKRERDELREKLFASEEQRLAFLDDLNRIRTIVNK